MDQDTGAGTGSPAPADDAATLPGAPGAAPDAPAPSRLRTRRATGTRPPEGEDRSDAGETASGQTTPQEPPSWRAKLTDEERAAARLELLREAEPEDYAKVNDRFDGYVGKRLQVKRAEDADAARKRELLGLRDKAVREGDPAAALAYTTATTEAELEEAHRSAWADAVGVFQQLDAHPVAKALVGGLAGRDYGQLAGGNGTLAALLYKADLAQNVVDHLPTWEAEMRASIEAELTKKLTPAIERQVRARLNGEEAVPDTGTGGAPGASDLPRTLPETRRWLDRMSPAEYGRREAEIDRHLASFSGRRVATR